MLTASLETDNSFIRPRSLAAVAPARCNRAPRRDGDARGTTTSYSGANGMSGCPKVYLAGPSVFRADAGTVATQLKATCAANGLEGLYPLDNDLGGPPSARRIFVANVALIRAASAVVADISPFRGPNVDDGTAWEIGFAHALGLPVFAYTNDPADLKHRIPRRRVGHVDRDRDGFEVEDFGLNANLMIAESVAGVWPTAEQAIEAAARQLLKDVHRTPPSS